MERETKKFKTSFGTEVEIYTYLTAGESNAIQNIFLSNMKVSVGGEDDASLGEISADLSIKAQDKALELLVKSVNGETDDVLNKIMDLRKEDADEIVEKINEVQHGFDEEKKTN